MKAAVLLAPMILASTAWAEPSPTPNASGVPSSPATLLSELQPGRLFEVTQKVDILVNEEILHPAPGSSLVALLTPEGVHPMRFPTKVGPSCGILKYDLDPEFREHVILPVGATIEVMSTVPSNAANPLFVGWSVTLELRVRGSHLKAKFWCHPGVPKQYMTVEVFEKLLRGYVRLVPDVKASPTPTSAPTPAATRKPVPLPSVE